MSAEDYNFPDDILEKAFSAVEEYVHAPQKPNEFTAAQMAERYRETHPYSTRHWLTILDSAEQDGILDSRIAHGGGRVFWVKEGKALDSVMQR